MTVGDRIKELRGDDSRKVLGSKLGVDQATIMRYENNQRQPDTDFVAKICRLYGVSAGWLIFGDNDQTVKTPAAINGPAGDFGEEYVKVPLVAAELAAGGGSLIDSKEVIKDLAFRRDWLRIRGRLEHMVCMTVQGDSMEPTLRNKDVALINLANTTPTMGGIFAVAHDGGLYIKRLIVEPGRLILRSDNSFYTDIVLDKADRATMNLVKIVGRAIWWCHDERVY